MKRNLSLLAFLFVSLTFVAAQGNGGNNGNGNNGNGNAYSNGHNPWANINAPQWLTQWLQNGGQIPMPLVVAVIQKERSWAMQNFGLNPGQMLQKYAQGLLTIEFVSNSPKSLTFFMKLGGVGIITYLEDY